MIQEIFERLLDFSNFGGKSKRKDPRVSVYDAKK